MTPAHQPSCSPELSNMTISGINTAITILSKWGCNAKDSAAILGIKPSTFYRYKRQPEGARLNKDQIDRLSYILNIHASLRTLFENPENVYGFMQMANLEPYFNGRPPLDVIRTGSHAALYETYRYIDSLLV